MSLVDTNDYLHMLELVSSQLKIDPGLILSLSKAENLALLSLRLMVCTHGVCLFIVAHEMPVILKNLF